MGQAGPARLQVDDDLVGRQPARPAEAEVGLAGQHDRAAAELDADAALRDRDPGRSQRGEALLEAADQVDGQAPQLRPVARAQSGEEPLDALAVVVDEAGERLVHQVHGRGLALPVDAQLDGLVGDGPAGRGHGPLEALPSRLDVVRLAAVDGRERVLADPQRVGGGQVVGDRPERLLHLVAELGRQPGRERRRHLRPSEQRDDRLLRRVVARSGGEIDHGRNRTQRV